MQIYTYYPPCGMNYILYHVEEKNTCFANAQSVEHGLEDVQHVNKHDIVLIVRSANTHTSLYSGIGK